MGSSEDTEPFAMARPADAEQREASRGFYKVKKVLKQAETPNTNFTHFLILLSGTVVKSQCSMLCQYMVIHKMQILVSRFLPRTYIKYELIV